MVLEWWCLGDVWVALRWHIDDVQVAFLGVRQVFSGGVWLFGWCLSAGVWKMFGWCLSAGVWKMFGLVFGAWCFRYGVLVLVFGVWLVFG